MVGKESSQPPQPPIASTEAPQMVSFVKLPILKKGEYILWTMKMEHYLAYRLCSMGIYLEWNKPSIDTLDIHDPYNNLKVYKADIKGSSGSSSNSHNVAFVFAQSTNSINELNAAYSVSTATGHSSRAQGNRSRDAGNAGYKEIDNGKRPAEEEDEQALVVHNGLCTYDWSYQVEEEATDFAVMAFTLNPSSSSSSNSEVQSCSKQCEQSYKQLKTLFDEQREKLSRAIIEIIGYDSLFNENEVLDIKEEEVIETVFDNRSSDEENSVANDRFKKVFTRSGRIPVSAAKPKAVASSSAAKPVNTVGLKQSVNFSRTTSTFHKLHSPIRMSFYKVTTHSRRNLTERVNTAGSKAVSDVKGNGGHPQQALKNKGIVNSGCSRHMIGNKADLANYQEIHDGGFVAFGSSRVLLRVPKQSNMYSFDLQNVVPSGDLTCLFAKASIDEPNLWHMRLGHVNFKTMNKLLKGNLSSFSSTYKSSDYKPADDKPKDDIGSKTVKEPVNKDDQAYRDKIDRLMSQSKEASDAADALRKEFKQGFMDQR
uniref:Ribonuclease H-like domain-containing protein n=1 Tax=Tanacetum cinerariifolium TaxID=118510 RepID=A0A6L2LDA8_TANCI|nr:ribonuclease H-like domain-containing protein [Tanacetum cinerariifolium]